MNMKQDGVDLRSTNTEMDDHSLTAVSRANLCRIKPVGTSSCRADREGELPVKG
jgi:hypothetical protein